MSASRRSADQCALCRRACVSDRGGSLRRMRPAPKGRSLGAAHRRSRRAFTLVEMMVVVAVITILVGAMMPEFSGTYATMQLSASTSRIGDMIAYCYCAANTQQIDYRLHFDPEMGRAWAMREVELEETGEREYQTSTFPGMQNYALPESVMFEVEDMVTYLNLGDDGVYYIQFRRDGTCDFARIRLISMRAGLMEISVNGLTGRVKIREVPLEEIEAEMEAEE